MSPTRRTLLHAASALALGGAGLTLAGPRGARARGASDAPGTILIVVANEIPHPRPGFPPGFWAAELTHPFAEFVAHRHPVTIASLEGGAVLVDPYSDPRHESGYSSHDVASLGFLTSPTHASLLATTVALADIDPAGHAAILVAGGQAPMVTFREHAGLQGLVHGFHDAGKPTPALCHGVAALLDIRLDDGADLVDGGAVTGFSAAEDAFVDEALGVTLFDWWGEPASRARGALYSEAGMRANHAVVDGHLITGQQQNSGGTVAQRMLEQLHG